MRKTEQEEGVEELELCNVVCLGPSHSVISMGDSLCVSLVVCRHAVNQSKDTQG